MADTPPADVAGPSGGGGSFDVSMRKDNSVKVTREHFALVPRYAGTCHKSQGQTLPKVIVDLLPKKGEKKNIEINHAYVPLSRVRTLDDLTILRDFDDNILKAQVNYICALMMKEFAEKDVCRDM